MAEPHRRRTAAPDDSELPRMTLMEHLEELRKRIVRALIGPAVAFVAPGLYGRERRHALPFILFTTLFFAAGGIFAYTVAFPFAVDFLIGMGSQFEPVIAADRYYRFLMYVIFGLGLMFELPVLIFLLSGLGVVTPRFLMRHFRWAVVLIFVLAAFVTPTPDIVNLCVFALPTIGLYLLGVAAAAVAAAGKKKAEG
jgi:sec-independent protein translocase protein TatC